MYKMKGVYVIWAIVVLVLIIGLTFIGFNYKSKMKPYKELEVNLTEATKKYVELKFLYPNEGEVTTIKLDELIEEGLISGLSVNGDKCDGYINLTYNGVYNYDSFIKCDNYKTTGY